MKNIAIIIPTLECGGAERVVSILSKEFIKKYRVFLLVFDSSNIVYDYEGELISLDNVAAKNIFGKLLNFLKRFWKIRKLKRKLNIDTTISFLGNANILNILTKRTDKIIVSVRSMPSKSKKNIYSKINHLAMKYLYNRANKIVAISEGVYQDLVNNYGINSDIATTIYNPISLETAINIDMDDKDGKTIENQFCIVTVGRLSDAKGQWHLIRAMKEVIIEVPFAELNIIGEGELRTYLENLIRDLDLKEKVKLLGYQENPFKYYKYSDLFVFSSLHEGFGNVLLEAMACNIPVVSTDCLSGPREILSPKTARSKPIIEPEISEYGVLVPVCDGRKYGHSDPLTKEELILAETIIKMYKDVHLRDELSSNGKKRVLEFRSDNIAKEWIEEIEAN